MGEQELYDRAQAEANSKDPVLASHANDGKNLAFVEALAASKIDFERNMLLRELINFSGSVR